jgi:hypothetical protein
MATGVTTELLSSEHCLLTRKLDCVHAHTFPRTGQDLCSQDLSLATQGPEQEPTVFYDLPAHKATILKHQQVAHLPQNRPGFMFQQDLSLANLRRQQGPKQESTTHKATILKHQQVAHLPQNARIYVPARPLLSCSQKRARAQTRINSVLRSAEAY